MKAFVKPDTIGMELTLYQVTNIVFPGHQYSCLATTIQQKLALPTELLVIEDL